MPKSECLALLRNHDQDGRVRRVPTRLLQKGKQGAPISSFCKAVSHHSVGTGPSGMA
jgi:hypothetical protein